VSQGLVFSRIEETTYLFEVLVVDNHIGSMSCTDSKMCAWCVCTEMVGVVTKGCCCEGGGADSRHPNLIKPDHLMQSRHVETDPSPMYMINLIMLI
jgi:hypothetical protein